MGSPEDNAKNWQVQELTNSVGRIETAVTKISTTIQDGLVSKEQLRYEIQAIHDRYDPMKRILTRLVWLAIPAFVALFASQAYNLFVNIAHGGK